MCYLSHPEAAPHIAYRSGGDRVGRFIFEYETDTGETRKGWAPTDDEWNRMNADWLPALQVHEPEELAKDNPSLAKMLSADYREREVMTGHRDLIPSFKPIAGGVLRSKIKRIIVNVSPCRRSCLWAANTSMGI